MNKKTPADTKVKVGGGSGGAPGTGVGIPLQSNGEDHSDSGYLSATHGSSKLIRAGRNWIRGKKPLFIYFVFFFFLFWGLFVGVFFFYYSSVNNFIFLS